MRYMWIGISGHHIEDFWPLSSGSVTGWGRWGSGQRWHWFGEGAPVSVSLQHDCSFFPVPLWKGRHLAVWYWRTITRCLSIAAFTCLCPGNWTSHFFSSWTSAQGVFIRYCISSIGACKNHHFAIVAIFNARHMSDCYSCTRPPCLAIVADMFKTYKKLCAASNNGMWLLRQPDMLL